MTVQELRQKGYQVKVRHTRFFDEYGVLYAGEFDNFLTRGEFQRAYDDNVIINIFGENTNSIFYPSEDATYGRLVQPFGGFTSVILTAPDGNIYTGKFNFNNKRFCRKTGFRAALGRCLKQGNIRENF